jgi:hypothetical protein
MNKTLKTIAWICLVLGLMGTVVDAGILVAGIKMAAGRQTAIEDIKDQNQTGNMPNAKNICIAKDADQDGKPDGDCLKMQAPGQPGQPGAGQPFRRAMIQKMRNKMDVRRNNGRGILLFLFLALGPILLVIGAVMLLVNREPKKAEVKEKKEVNEVKEAKDQKKK